MYNMYKKINPALSCAMLVLFLSLFHVMPSIAAAPPETSPLPSAGENGYVSLHKYVSPTETDGVYRVRLEISSILAKGSRANLAIFLNNNGAMQQANFGHRSIIARQALQTMMNALYQGTTTDVRERINVAIYTHSLPLLTAMSSQNIPRPPGAWMPTDYTKGGPYLPQDVITVNHTPAQTSAEIVRGVPAGFVSAESYDNSSLMNLLSTNNAVNNFQLEGVNGTNTAPQYVFRKAKEIFSSSSMSNDMNYVVYTDDGGIKNSPQIISADVYFKTGYAPWSGSNDANMNNLDRIENAVFDYDHLDMEPWMVNYSLNSNLNQVASINDTLISASKPWLVSVQYGGLGWIQDAATYRASSPQNVISFLWEAEETKKAGINIYTVGWNSSTKLSTFTPANDNNLNYLALAHAASSPDNFLVVDTDSPTTALNDLEIMFKSIAEKIQRDIQLGIHIEDKIGSSFTIEKFPGMPLLETTLGTATIQDKTIQWELGNDMPTPQNPAVLSYYVRIEEGTDPSKYYQTNEYAFITFSNKDGSGNDTTIVKYFPIPYVKGDGDVAESTESVIVSASPVETQRAGAGLLPILGGSSQSVLYTASVSSSPNSAIQNESLQESVDAVPVTSTTTYVVAVTLVLTISAAYIIHRKRKKRQIFYE